MIIREGGGYESLDEEEENQPDSEGEDYSTAEQGECLVTRRTLSVLPQDDDLMQRENIFHTRCNIKGKVCNLIIDGGSCTNVASAYMVDKLGIPTTKHPKPYRLRWLNDKSDLRVTDQVTIPFKIGRYEDEVRCDVVPMQAGHLLLGRPWQFDREATHHGRTNLYSFTYKKRKFNLVPLTPSEVHEGQLKQAQEGSTKTNLLVNTQTIRKAVSTKHQVVLMLFKETLRCFGDLQLPKEIKNLLRRFQDVFPEDIPHGLPPTRGIEHQIDFIPGSAPPIKAFVAPKHVARRDLLQEVLVTNNKVEEVEKIEQKAPTPVHELQIKQTQKKDSQSDFLAETSLVYKAVTKEHVVTNVVTLVEAPKEAHDKGENLEETSKGVRKQQEEARTEHEQQLVVTSVIKGKNLDVQPSENYGGFTYGFLIKKKTPEVICKLKLAKNICFKELHPKKEHEEVFKRDFIATSRSKCNHPQIQQLKVYDGSLGGSQELQPRQGTIGLKEIVQNDLPLKLPEEHPTKINKLHGGEQHVSALVHSPLKQGEAEVKGQDLDQDIYDDVPRLDESYASYDEKASGLIHEQKDFLIQEKKLCLPKKFPHDLSPKGAYRGGLEEPINVEKTLGVVNIKQENTESFLHNLHDLLINLEGYKTLEPLSFKNNFPFEPGALVLRTKPSQEGGDDEGIQDDLPQAAGSTSSTTVPNVPARPLTRAMTKRLRIWFIRAVKDLLEDSINKEETRNVPNGVGILVFDSHQYLGREWDSMSLSSFDPPHLTKVGPRDKEI